LELPTGVQYPVPGNIFIWDFSILMYLYNRSVSMLTKPAWASFKNGEEGRAKIM
jgi:hypothetical protein